MPENEGAVRRELIEQLGRTIQESLNPHGQEKYRFALLVFSEDDAKDGTRLSYLANAECSIVLMAMKGFIARNEGRLHEFNPMVKQ